MSTRVRANIRDVGIVHIHKTAFVNIMKIVCIAMEDESPRNTATTGKLFAPRFERRSFSNG